MKPDREKMRMLSELDDRTLWLTLCALAKEKGYDLNVSMPNEEDMAKIKRMLRGEERVGMSEAMRLINNFKKK